MSDADKWPKSFRWHADFNGKPDIVTFLNDDDTDRDLQGVEWTYRECVDEPAGDVAYWEPTGEHRKKSPPAPSQDDMKKAEVAKIIESVRCSIQGAKDPYINDDGRIMYLRDAISELADAVERLAK